MISLLILTNAYPSEEKPYAGVFVKNQVECINEKNSADVHTEVFFLKRSFTGKIGGILKYGKLLLKFFPVIFRRYDVIHLHFFFPLIWFSAIYLFFHHKTKLVVTLHGTDVIDRFYSPISKWLHSKLAKKIDYVIAVGNAVGEEFSDRLGRKIDAVFPAGIDDRVFYPVKKDKVDYDLIFVGSFVDRKGFDLYIEALLLCQPGLRVCFIGSGDMEPLLEKLKDRHQVTLRNNLVQTEIAEYLHVSRFLVLPSRSEPFGLVVTEGLYCGVPAIVSYADGLVTQVKDGFNGFVISNEPEMLSGCIKKALNMPLENYEIMKANAANSNAQYSLTSVCARQVEIYRSLNA